MDAGHAPSFSASGKVVCVHGVSIHPCRHDKLTMTALIRGVRFGPHVRGVHEVGR